MLLVRKIAAIRSENYTKLINILRGQYAQFLNFKAGSVYVYIYI
jgi:hypothetical protein